MTMQMGMIVISSPINPSQEIDMTSYCDDIDKVGLVSIRCVDFDYEHSLY